MLIDLGPTTIMKSTAIVAINPGLRSRPIERFSLDAVDAKVTVSYATGIKCCYYLCTGHDIKLH